MRYVSYVRDTSREGHEAAVQQQNIEKWAADHEAYPIMERYEDSYGSVDGFRKLISDGIDRRFDFIILDSIHACGESLSQAREVLLVTFFPFGIHFACVDDGFSSARKTEQEVTDYFLEKKADISRAIIARAMEKKYDSPLDGRDVRYGYKLSEDRRYLIPDEVTAPVVKEIFELFIAGKNCPDIAKQMNAEGHIVPIKYKHDAVGCVKEQEYSWKYRAVRQILTNPIYTGQGIKKVRGQETLLEVEPLISRDDYEKVKSCFAALREKQGEIKESEYKYNVFSGRVWDAVTGQRLSCKTIPKTGIRVFVKWRTDSTVRKEDRTRNIPYDAVVEMVLERLREEKRLAEKVRERIAADQAEMEKCLDRLREKALLLFWETESIVRAGMTETLEDDGFGEIMKQEAMIRRAFSAKNPWVDKYCNLEVGESVTKELVGAAVEKVLIADFADVEVVPLKKEWKQMLPKEWMEG